MVRRHKVKGTRHKGQRYKAQGTRNKGVRGLNKLYIAELTKDAGNKLQGSRSLIRHLLTQRAVSANLVPCALRLVPYFNFFIFTISILVSLTLMTSNS